MDLGVHLPLMPFEAPLSPQRIQATVDAARECGFAAISANDHLVFQTPWLDGLTALASVIERSGEMELATTVALAVLRGPVQLAKALAAIDVRPLDERLGRAAGELLAAARHSDVIDAALVLLAADGDHIVTSDPDDLEPLARASDRHVEIITV